MKILYGKFVRRQHRELENAKNHRESQATFHGGKNISPKKILRRASSRESEEQYKVLHLQLYWIELMVKVMAWSQEYLENLKLRDDHDRLWSNLAVAYQQMIDRIFKLEQDYPKFGSSPDKSDLDVQDKVKCLETNLRDSINIKERIKSEEWVQQIRADLAVAQRKRVELQTSHDKVVKELQYLRETLAKEVKRVEQLMHDKSMLERRMGDRDEELKGKTKLVESVQDELLSLHIQLNIVEAKSAQLEKENKELIDRWIARVEHEANTS